MGVVRIDDELHEKIEKYITQDTQKYKYPNLSTFVNNAIYEKLKEEKRE